MGGKAFFSFNTATNEIARAAYKENMQTLDCCELCSLVRDKIIISSPSSPNPQAACRIMIGVVLSHLFCIPLRYTAFLAYPEPHPPAANPAAAATQPQPSRQRWPPRQPTATWKARFVWSTASPSHLCLLYLLRRHFLPSHPSTHTCKRLKLSISRQGWFVAGWALICWYKEVSLALGALPGWDLRSRCSSSRLPDNLVVTSLGGCSKSAAIFFRRAGTCNIIKYVKSVLIQCVETPG